jgi:hypothetical protein
MGVSSFVPEKVMSKKLPVRPRVILSQLVNTFWRNMALPRDSLPIFLPFYEQNL